MGRLPCGVAQNRNGSGSGNVVGGLKQTTGVSANSKGREVVPRDVFRALRLGHVVADPDVHRVLARLKSGELLKLRGVVLDLGVELEKKKIKRAFVFKNPAVDTTVVKITDPIQRRRIRHWKRAQQNGMDEREDCDICANTQRNCKHDRGGES